MQSLFFLTTTMFKMGINKKIAFNKHFARKYIRAYTIQAKHKRTSHQQDILVYALARTWNGRPTLTKLQVKQIPLWAAFGGT